MKSWLIYPVVALAAIVAAVALWPQDSALVERSFEGDMRKLVWATRDVPSTSFTGEDGAEMTLAAFKDRPVVLNFWATWCAPCRKEMPSLAALAEALPEAHIVTISVGQAQPGAVDRFFNEIGVTTLPKHADPKMALSRDMGVLGLPVTVLIDRDGKEIARLTGEADWSSPEAVALIRSLAQD